MKNWLKYFLIGFILGAILGFFPPFHILTLPLIIPLSKVIAGENLRYLMAVFNAIIFSIIGFIIGFSKNKNEDEISGSKLGFFVSLIASLFILLPLTTYIFRGVISNGVYLPSIFIFIFGILMLFSSFMIKNLNYLKIGSKLAIVLGLIPILVFLLISIFPGLLYYGFGEFLDNGSLTVFILISISSILSIISGIIGLKDTKIKNL